MEMQYSLWFCSPVSPKLWVILTGLYGLLIPALSTIGALVYFFPIKTFPE